MGIFNFVKKGIENVKNLIVHCPPIIKGLESLTEIVANAIPGVGPVVNAAIPALNGILGDRDKVSSILPPPPDTVLASKPA
ncbi:hypothetical protein KCU65_g6192, partial [Aureobasidium melanogenum]